MSGAAPSSLSTLLERERDRIEKTLAEVVTRALEGVGPPLHEPMAYALSTTGKRLRPILCVAAYRVAAGGAAEAPPAVYRLSCALEVVHTYSLVHDDLPAMDDDDLRRGRPTVHKVFGNRLATLAGAALLPLAVEVLERHAGSLGLPPEERARLVVELCRAAGGAGMVGGQLLDLEGESTPVDAPGLETIHRAKTGALLAASLRLGALAARADEATLRALTLYGEALGLAFQITDDVLDVTGDSRALGKTAGRDQILQKASYPALFGVEGARALARARADEAQAALAGLPAADLIALADYVVERRR